MTFRLDNILEDWAAMYKPIGHDKNRSLKDKRFFRIKDLGQENEWHRNANTLKSPCLLYSAMIDAESQGNGKSVNYLHKIYFAAKLEARSLAKSARQDNELGAEQQMELDDMVQDLLAYLYKIRETGVCPISGTPFDTPTRNALRGLDLEKAEWASIPAKFAEWYPMGLYIQQITPRLLCVNPERYEFND